ncbi:MAG: sulfatase [Candidatus Brocadiia bacterium]
MTRPNILLILTDQQSATMMGCAGNPCVRTPAMDGLAASGTRFDRAYCTNPVCVPSRFSLMTGRMPSEIGLWSNDSRHIEAVPERILRGGPGWLLGRAGYRCAYAGKVHLPKMRPEQLGFEVLTADERDALAEAAADFVRQPRDAPFFLVASFINPHDICYMAIRDFGQSPLDRRLLEKGEGELATLDKALELPEGMSQEDFLAGRCPPLPPNFEPQEDEPEAIRRLLAERPFRRRAREEWSPERWRMHRWAYVRLTEFVDAQIARVLDALRQADTERDTVVIFTSDHGDMDSAHRMEHKTAFYDQAARIPLVISQPGTTSPGAVDETHLVSNGLDIVPTLCDYAGVEPPADLAGLSLRPIAAGRPPAQWRDALPLESQLGRGIVTRPFKYLLYDEGESREQLMDLEADPHETRNAARDPDKQDVLAELRDRFRALFG